MLSKSAPQSLYIEFERIHQSRPKGQLWCIV